MSAIGYVNHNREADSYRGTLRTLSIRTDIEIIPNRNKTHETQPDYRVYSGPVELGGGWIKRSEQTGRDYISLGLAAPEFGPKRLFVNLGRAAGQDDDDCYALIWNPAN